MFTIQDKKDLFWAMKKVLVIEVNEILVESTKHNLKNYILNETNYEQLLNICYNKTKEKKPVEVLEQIALEEILKL